MNRRDFLVKLKKWNIVMTCEVLFEAYYEQRSIGFTDNI